MLTLPLCRPLLAAIALSLPVLAVAQSSGAAPSPSLARSLQDNTWTLQSTTEGSSQPIAGIAVPGHSFVMRFDARRLSITGGCNNMSGSWRISEKGRLLVGRLAATMRACEPALMAADRALGAVLMLPMDIKLDPGATPTLQLTTPKKQTLQWVGQPTMESLHGAPTRVFLEVAAQTVPCQPGASTQCLQVRERRFDDKGLRIDPPGEWRAFSGTIEGYKHTPGVSNVVRVNRFQRSGTAANDASAAIYVLDMVIESAVAKP